MNFKICPYDRSIMLCGTAGLIGHIHLCVVKATFLFLPKTLLSDSFLMFIEIFCI